jgi:hypothetical protein
MSIMTKNDKFLNTLIRYINLIKDSKIVILNTILFQSEICSFFMSMKAPHPYEMMPRSSKIFHPS